MGGGGHFILLLSAHYLPLSQYLPVRGTEKTSYTFIEMINPIMPNGKIENVSYKSVRNIFKKCPVYNIKNFNMPSD